MRRLGITCERCKRKWVERGFHVRHEDEKSRRCPWETELGKKERCNGKLEIRILGEAKSV